MRSLAIVAALVVALLGAFPAEARSDRADAGPTVAINELPTEARETLARIQRGGPFPYDRDGVVFGNRERLLPPKPRGYYHEYTVQTPAAKARGARRIVCGGDAATLAECYYSNDHYQSFKRIRP